MPHSQPSERSPHGRERHDSVASASSSMDHIIYHTAHDQMSHIAMTIGPLQVEERIDDVESSLNYKLDMLLEVLEATAGDNT